MRLEKYLGVYLLIIVNSIDSLNDPGMILDDFMFDFCGFVCLSNSVAIFNCINLTS